MTTGIIASVVWTALVFTIAHRIGKRRRRCVVRVGEPDGVPIYKTQDEAIARALDEVGPDGLVEVHAGDCQSRDFDDGACTCTPITLRRGAVA